MPNHYKTRTNEKCPDGMEHQMSNGSWMCGEVHTYEHGGGLLEGPSHEEGGIFCFFVQYLLSLVWDLTIGNNLSSTSLVPKTSVNLPTE